MTRPIPVNAWEDCVLRVDLTPLDMFAAGYIVRVHWWRGSWCWWHGHASGGECWSEPCKTLEDVYKSARRRMTGDEKKAQPVLCEVTA